MIQIKNNMWDLILSDAKRWKEKNECMKIVGGGGFD